jgi:hypothetical protein
MAQVTAEEASPGAEETSPGTEETSSSPVGGVKVTSDNVDIGITHNEGHTDDGFAEFSGYGSSDHTL